MQSLMLWVHMLVCVAIVVLVLLQHGKGADAGATFGGGSSNSMFGSQGSMPFLMKLTAALALVFFVTSLMLSLYAVHSDHRDARLPSVNQTVTTGSASKTKG